MKTHQAKDDPTQSPDTPIAEEAAAWLLCFRTPVFGPDDPYRDPEIRHRAFFEWIKRSAAHVLIFMEMMELERRFKRLDADALADIRRLIEEAPAAFAAAPAEPGSPPPQDASHVNGPWYRTGATLGLIAAGCAAAAFLYLSSKRPDIYSTIVGEQHQYVLKDGSAIHLNTDTRIEVDFSNEARAVRLIRGEAFFSVKHDARRPFTVVSGRATVWDVGTDFDVRQGQGAQSVNVAVVKGKVKVEATPEPATTRQPIRTADDTLILSAGEMAEITSRSVIKVTGTDVEDATSWRHNRLIFRKARLADAVAEFNRYNSVQIRVEGAAAQATLVTGIFDTGGYQDFLRYAAKLPTVSVAPEGNSWVIRSR